MLLLLLLNITIVACSNYSALNLQYIFLNSIWHEWLRAFSYINVHIFYINVTQSPSMAFRYKTGISADAFQTIFVMFYYRAIFLETSPYLICYQLVISTWIQSLHESFIAFNSRVCSNIEIRRWNATTPLQLSLSRALEKQYKNWHFLSIVQKCTIIIIGT